MRKSGFTLIELLIVVAIIGILAAIAVPNFLNAQVRAKIARSQSDIRMLRDVVRMRNLDTNLWLIDNNDCGSNGDLNDVCCFPGSFFGVKPREVDLEVLKGDNHFDGQIYQPLTTPVNYMGSIPTDPFGRGVFYSYEDWGCANSPNGVFGLLAAAGPDFDSGDWHPDFKATAYDSTNGVVSNGDLWYVWKFRKTANNDGELNYDRYFRANPWGF